MHTRPEDTRFTQVLTYAAMQFSFGIKARDFLDAFGNICTRLVAPQGRIEIRSDFLIADSGLPDDFAPDAEQWELDNLRTKR